MAFWKPHWTDTARALARSIADDQIPGRAAQMAFYFFLSIFPTLLILMASLHLFLDAHWLARDTVLARLEPVAPDAVVEFLDRLLDHLESRPRVSFAWGVAVALWAASTGMAATIRGLNAAYGIDDRRGWWRGRLVGLALTLALMLLTALALLLLTYGAPLARAAFTGLGWSPSSMTLWRIVQWPLVFGFVLLAFDLLYHFGPNRPQPRWRWLQPGTLLAIALWLGASLVLDYYVSNFNHYSIAYGSIGAIIVVLLWFYLTGIAILAGAEVNARLEQPGALKRSLPAP